MEVLPRIDHSDMSDLLLSDVESAKIEQLLSRLELFDSMTVELQNSKTTMCCARVIFHGVVRSYCEMESGIGTTARIIENINFESALVDNQSNINTH